MCPSQHCLYQNWLFGGKNKKILWVEMCNDFLDSNVVPTPHCLRLSASSYFIYLFFFWSLIWPQGMWGMSDGPLNLWVFLLASAGWLEPLSLFSLIYCLKSLCSMKSFLIVGAQRPLHHLLLSLSLPLRAYTLIFRHGYLHLVHFQKAYFKSEYKFYENKIFGYFQFTALSAVLHTWSITQKVCNKYLLNELINEQIPKSLH